MRDKQCLSFLRLQEKAFGIAKNTGEGEGMPPDNLSRFPTRWKARFAPDLCVALNIIFYNGNYFLPEYRCVRFVHRLNVDLRNNICQFPICSYLSAMIEYMWYCRIKFKTTKFKQ